MPDSPQLERPARPQRRHSASGGSLLNHSLSSALRAFGVIFLGELSLVLTIWLVFGSFHHTQLMAIGTMVRGGVFCTALVLFILIFFLMGYRAFAYFFRITAVILGVSCLFCASYFVSLRSEGFRNLGLAFVLLASVPLIAFYMTTFNRTVHNYLARKRWLRDHNV